jgi:hypothetical protein
VVEVHRQRGGFCTTGGAWMLAVTGEFWHLWWTGRGSY